MEELLTYPRDCKINFTYPAMKYRLQNCKNAGQTLHQLLIDAGIKVDQYKKLPQSHKENNNYCLSKKTGILIRAIAVRKLNFKP